MNIVSLYIHIPFCVSKCAYCDFISYSGISDDKINSYVSTLLEEIKSYEKYNLTASNIYFGGGTPSVLDPAHIREILNAITNSFKLKTDPEITIEINPKTVDRDKLNSYKDMGINRISMGAQTFDEKLLERIGRIHSVEDIYNTYELLRQAGFDNVNIDLIYGLPLQNPDEWQDSVQKALNLNPKHLSLYCFELHENTPIFHNIKKWSHQYKSVMPSEERAVSMYEYACSELKSHGYVHYEISNFAKPGCESRHNKVYWHNMPYIGLGAGAHSYYKQRRFFNTSDLEAYISDFDSSKTREEKQSWKEEMEETIFMGLRLLKEGLNLTDFSDRFNTDIYDIYGAKIENLIKNGLLIKEDNSLKLSDRAVFISNEIFLEFLED